MQGLIDFLHKHLYWLVFLLLEVVSMVLLVRFNRYQHSVWLTTANAVSGTLMRWVSDGWEYVHLGEENKHMEAVNQSLRRQVLELRRQVRKERMALDTMDVAFLDIGAGVGISDSTMLRDGGVQTRATHYHLVQAQVIGSTLHRSNNLLTLDRGEADGIRPEMGVVNAQGVVGIVFLTSRHFSVVIPLVNTQSQVSCRLRGSEFFGTMEWVRGDAQHSYAVNIPRHAQLEKGQQVETNGYSDIFPEGIPVGRVEQIGDSPDGMSYRLKVKLAVDFATLRNVSVITDYTQPERIQLEEHADSIVSGKTPPKS